MVIRSARVDRLDQPLRPGGGERGIRLHPAHPALGADDVALADHLGGRRPAAPPAAPAPAWRGAPCPRAQQLPGDAHRLEEVALQLGERGDEQIAHRVARRGPSRRRSGTGTPRPGALLPPASATRQLRTSPGGSIPWVRRSRPEQPPSSLIATTAVMSTPGSPPLRGRASRARPRAPWAVRCRRPCATIRVGRSGAGSSWLRSDLRWRASSALHGSARSARPRHTHHVPAPSRPTHRGSPCPCLPRQPDRGP